MLQGRKFRGGRGGSPALRKHCLIGGGTLLAQFAIITLLLLTSFAPMPVIAQTYAGKIGVEEGCRGNGEFVDLGKTLRQFTTIGTSNNAPMDSNGWPTTDGETVLMDDRPLPAWAPPLDDPAGYQPDESGVYHCQFTGQATLGTSGGSLVTFANQLYNSGTNITTFDMTLPAGTWQTGPALIVVDFTNTKRASGSATNTGITGLQCLRPGYGYPSGSPQMFTNPLLNAFGPFDHVRYMGWRNTNYQAGYYGDAGHHLINWTDRELPSDASQGMTTLRPGAVGISWEYIILLANQINKDVWINVPISATGYNTTDTTSYIYQLALLLKNGDAFTGGHGLNAGLHVYIEHSNEVWNFSFSQYTWNKLEAVDAVAGTGSLGTTHVNSDGTTDQEVWAHRRHAERLYQIAQIFATVFGTGSLNTTIRPVYASWTINAQSYYTDVLTWMNTQYGAPSSYFYAIAGTSYFNNTPTAGQSVASILSSMTANSDANLVYTKQLRTVANNFGLKLFAYEAGPDNGGGDTTNIGNRILANRDPGMTTAIEYDVRNNYFGQGLADSYNYFSMSGAYTRYGSYGASDDITKIDVSQPKWAAIYNLTGYNPGGPPAAPTGLTATSGNTQITLNWTASGGATSYNVLRSTVSGSGYASVATGIVPVTYTNTGLTNGTTYYFVVTATNANGTSGNSSQASAAPTGPPAAPTSLTATAGNSQVALTWTASTGATSYNVKRSTVNGSGYATVSSPTVTNYTNTGLTNGTTYYFVVTAVNGGGESGNSNQASATPQVSVPAAPSGLTATAGDAQVALSWTASSGATSYNVLRSTVSGSGYASVATGIAATTYTNTGLTDGTTYYFVVTATNTAGTSGNSNQASATPVANTGTLLASEPFAEATGALQGASGGAGWNGGWFTQNNDATVPGYNISNTTPLTYSTLQTSGNYGIGGNAGLTTGRGLDVSTGGAFNNYLTGGLIGLSGKTLWMSLLLRKDAATQQQNFITLHPGNIQWYAQTPLVSAGYFGAASETAGTKYWSLEIGGTVTKTAVPITIGATALLVVRMDFATTNTITLYVNPSSLGGGAPGTSSASATTASSIAFRSLAYYAGDGTGQSSIDEIRFGDTYAAVTPTSGGSPPAAPAGLTATGGNAQVALTWSASSGATSYNVKRSTVNGSGYATISSPTVTTYTNTGLANGTTYYYVVTAVNSVGESGNSNQASATPQVPAPAAPANLTATPGNGQVVLNWTSSTGATSYTVNFTTGGNYTVAGSPTTNTFTHTGLTNGTLYTYYVTATNAGGTSGASSPASATPAGPPAAPTGLAATPGNAQVALSWSASTGATSYNVKRSTVNGSGYATVSSPTVTNYTNTGLTNGTTYYYVVTAVNANGESANSNQASATPVAPPAAPAGLTATPGNAQAALSWTVSSGATSYSVLRSTVNGSGYASVATGIAVTTYTNTGLTNGTTYYFVVTATNAGGTSGNSNQASATPVNNIGTLLASEPFAEATGKLDAANGGTGWNGGWFTQNNDGTVPGYNVSSGSLSYSTLTTSGGHGIGGNAALTAGRGLDISAGGAFNNYLTGGLIGLSGKTLWMSVLLRKDIANQQQNFITLHPGNIQWYAQTPLVSAGYFGAASETSGTKFWSLEIGGTVTKTAVPITIGTTALLVVRMDFAATNTVTLYVNPASLGGSAPGTSSASGTTASSIAFRSLAYYAGDATGQSSIDEIRFGDTYAAVTQ